MCVRLFLKADPVPQQSYANLQQWPEEALWFHFKTPRLYCEPPKLKGDFHGCRLFTFHPDPAFHSDADPYPDSQNDPDPQHCLGNWPEVLNLVCFMKTYDQRKLLLLDISSACFVVHSCSCFLYVRVGTMLRIRDILVRIWIRGFVSPTNGSGSWSWFFPQWSSSRRQLKFILFLLFTFWSYIFINFPR